MINKIDKSDIEVKYLQAIDQTKEKRLTFALPIWKRTLKYPIQVTLFKFFVKFLPFLSSKIVVKNKLFWGQDFYTEGYYIDYYWCGFITEDNEMRLTKYLIRSLKGDDVFFDIGAHYGFFSVLAYRLISGQEKEVDKARQVVHCFEPTPTTFAVLAKNLDGKAILNNVAVSDKVGNSLLSVSDDYAWSGSNTLNPELAYELTKTAQKRSFQVATTTIDEYCTHNSAPTILKIDVEASEFLVLSGALLTIRKYHPSIIMEVWPKGFNDEHLRAFDLLVKEGYVPQLISEDGTLKVISRDIASNLPKTDNVVFIYPSV